MKKVLLSMLALCMSVSMFGATIYLNTTTVDYGADNAFLAIWTWGGNSADAWSIFSPVTGEEKLFSAEIADDRTGGKIIRFANSVTEPSWSAQQWNATGNLTIPNDANMITLTQWNDETPGSWSTYTPAASTDPSEIVYSIKHGWKDGQDASWSYKDLTPNGDGTYSIRDIYGGTGCNWKSTISSEKWISEPILVGSPAKGDSAVFTLDPTAETITITKIVSTDPTVALTVTGNAELGSAVTLSATFSNIEGEVTYNYYVKVDEGEFTALEGDNYTFAAAGTYTFKVEAIAGGEVKATDTKEVVIKSGDEPATDIIYFVNVDNWETVYCYAWTNGASDQNAVWPGVLATKADSQVMGKDVYYYESASGQYANCIFHCNGDNCQTEDLTWASGQYYYNGEWKTLAELTAPTVALTVTGNAELGSAVTLSAVVSNIEGEVTYNYYVKVDEGEFTALASTNYTFDAAGTYTFKVEAIAGGEVKAIDTKEITITNVVTEYYLVGYINGADYGCYDDAENLGEYKFVDGKLTATFTEDSYVMVKTGDNNNWYMSDTYVEPAANVVATLKQDGTDKVGVKANVEVSFTLTNNGDGTLTLAYSTPAVALTVTGDTKLGSAVTLSAAVSNIEGEVTYNYYIKVDEGEFTALEGTNYTFDALGTYTFKVEAKVGDVVKATDTKTVTIAYDWYVRGSFTTNWAVDIKYGMPKNTEGVYSLSFELEAGTYAFKLSKVDTWVGAIGADAVNADCSDQGWEGDDNIKFTLGTAATVTVTYDGEKICLTSTLGKFGQVVITSYTIVGDAAIVGADWNTTNTAADMTDNGDGTWTWEKKDCDLEVKDYTYKVVGNHDYAVYQYPASDANKVLPITEIGTYDIVYTFKPGETPELTAVATKHSSPVTGLQESVVPVIYTRDGRIYGADDMRIYTVLGLDVTNMNGQLNGIYVVKTQAGIVKVVVR
ncbi:MAG: starch-binding protein [Paludibacteraceae bacterium]|nr:starch-binding protein [Paludibacteraceae bacterium]